MTPPESNSQPETQPASFAAATGSANLNQCLDEQRKTIGSLRTQLEWLWANCKIVYWPRDESYPIEHNPNARKYSRDVIEAAMPNNASERTGADNPNP